MLKPVMGMGEKKMLYSCLLRLGAVMHILIALAEINPWIFNKCVTLKYYISTFDKQYLKCLKETNVSTCYEYTNLHYM